MNGVTKFTTSLLNSFFGVILFVVSCAAFFLPYEIRIVPQIAELLPKVQLVCCGILIICFLLLYASCVRVFRDNWMLWASVIFIALLIYATYINYADMGSALSDKGLLALANLLLFAVFFKVNPKRYLLIFYFIYLIFMAANNYSVFATWGTGMWNEWQTYLDDTYSLVGNYNLGIMYAMPVFITGSVWASKYGRWLEIINYLACFSCIWMAFKCHSVAQIIAYVVVLFVFILNDIMHAAPGFYKFLQIFNSAVLMIAVTILFFCIVVFEKLELLEKLGFDGDFHGRRAIWNNSMELIAQKPIFGNGVETIGTTASKFAETQAAHSHCFFLEVPYLTGIVGTVIFIAMIVICIIAVFRAKNIHTKWLLSALMGTTFLAAVVESYPTVFMIIVPGLVYYIAKKDREEELEKEEILAAAERAAAERQRPQYERQGQRRKNYSQDMNLRERPADPKQNHLQNKRTNSPDEHHLTGKINARKKYEEDVFDIDDLLDEQADYIAKKMKKQR